MGTNRIEVPLAMREDRLGDQFETFTDIVKILRIHCPWDREQTNESIAHLIIEESYEALEAIQKKDDKEFAKELGDLLLHIVMHSVMAEERGAFGLLDVMKLIQEKIVFRHPHVFRDVNVSGQDEVVQNWEALKKLEGKKSTLDGVPFAMPSLLRAERIQHKASKVGFDWDDKKEVWKKVEEELLELKEAALAGDSEKAKEELGDLLFSIVNAARFDKIVAEEALQFTNSKFIRRFKFIEESAAQAGRDMKDMSLAEMDALWDEAKLLERNDILPIT
ncbi:MAG: Nucleoside triphosphate pyrophosphohydrolase [Ignavibacteria bacterium]|nr:Nucleoside triphosphate pyrophosphohydrolase [Ignavibacteria bacterium]